MVKPKVILNQAQLELTIKRLVLEIIENYQGFDDFAIIGLQPRGSFLANRLAHLLKTEYNIKNLELGLLDITFSKSTDDLSMPTGL